MHLVDSHCHLDQLDLSLFQDDLHNVIKQAEDFHVRTFLCVCITLKDFPSMMQAISAYPEVYASVGLHPNEVVDEEEPTIEQLVHLANGDKIIAIGETGLDYYRSTGDVEWQRQRFRNHIRAANQTGKPLIVHSRQAKEDTLKLLREENAEKASGILHCFSEDWDMAKAAMDLNFYISFSGIVTFNSAKTLQDVAKKIPLERMLIETDSPYLAPIPHRGKPNQPAYVRYVAECIAALRGEPVEKIAEQTTENFYQLFHL